MAETTNNNASWLELLIQPAQEFVASYYNYQTAKEQAKLQAGIDNNTAQTSAQQTAQATASANLVRNTLLIVGGTLGMILAFGFVKKALK